MKKLKVTVGPWVAGDSFWDREAELALLAEKLKDGAHLLLVAQRRMGKTSLLKEASCRFSERYVCLYADLEKASSAPDAVVELGLAALPFIGRRKRMIAFLDGLVQDLSSVIESITVGDVGLKLRAGLDDGNWDRKGDELLAALADADKPVVVLLDEVPILVNRMLKGADFKLIPERRAATDRFLSWLRAASLRHQGKLRFVLTGSIGLEPILRQANLSATLNNFTPFELGPWDENACTGCLDALGNQYGLTLSDEVKARVFALLGCGIPHHVQMFFSFLRAACLKAKRTSVLVEDVDQVYEKDLLSIRGHVELTHYEDRLALVLGHDLLPIALEMLTEAAVTGHLTDEACRVIRRSNPLPSVDLVEAQKTILWVMEHDGYLTQRSARYEFVSRLLREWWKRRHEFGYVPAGQRGETL